MSNFETEDLWREAKILANSKATQEVFARMERRILDEWTNSSPMASAERDAAYHRICAIRAFRNGLAALASEPDVTAFNRRLKGDR